MLSRWDALSDRAKEWLLRWSCEHDAVFAARAIHQALGGVSEELILCALELAAELHVNDETITRVASPYVHSPDARFRRVAYKLVPERFDWPPRFASESDTAAAVVCLLRMLKSEPPETLLPALICYLRDPRWEVRAAARNAIAKIGRAASDDLSHLLHDSDENVRIAVASILLEFGQNDLLAHLVPDSE
ncbi:MAG: HEAT repeat domain-containing protein [Acidobacteriaceae bacterium]|nr:HEAT repeat domain-containing protein [Acidobacteriaceae bacterium]